MHKVWSNIIGKDVFPECLDEQTVHRLHVRMPAHSVDDVFYIGKQLRLSNIFPTARDERVQSSLLGRIQSCERVLTFKSFHADMVLLEACYHPLRQLWPKDDSSLRQACKSSLKNGGSNFEASYLDIWLYSIRNRPRFSRLEDTGLKKVGDKPASGFPEAAVADLAAFAASRDFSSEMIEAMQMKGQHVEHDNSAEVPILSRAYHEVHLQDRCGRPSKAHFDSFWGQLFSRNVLTECDGPADRYPTPFAVARNFVRCLFQLEPPYEVQETGTLHSVQRMSGVSRPSSSTLNRPGRSSILLAPTLNLSQLEFDVDVKTPFAPDTRQCTRRESAAAYRMSTSSLQSRPIASKTFGKVATSDDGDDMPTVYRQKLLPGHKITAATTSVGVNKSRQQAPRTRQSRGRGLRSLHLVEVHCPKSIDRN